MVDITLDAGTLTANVNERIVSGLLVPFGEEGRTNLGRLTVNPGTITIPADVTGMSLNVEHRREDVVGTLVAAAETDAGIVGTFRIAQTPEGDQALSEIAEGTRKHLSAEVANVKVKDAVMQAGARLFAAALVQAPAFPSATLLASAPDTDEQEEEDDPTVARSIDEATPESTTFPDETPDAAPAAEVTEAEAGAEAADEGDEMETGVPTTLAASAKAADKKDNLTASGVARLVAQVKNGSSDDTVLAALSDIKISGAGALPAAGVLQPSWLGELWNGRGYQRRYMPLIRNGVIRALDEKGFVLDQGTALVTTWAGNKAEIGSGTASTSVVSSTLAKWGYAADIAREFFDLPGGEEVIAAFTRGVIESYARVTDEWTLGQIVATATPNIVAPDTYPTDYPSVFGLLIQGAEAVEDNGDTPTFAILNQAAWDEFKYTPKDQVPEFISFTFGIGQDATGATMPRIVKGDIGIDDTPAAIVGASVAAHVNEREGASPVVLDALDIAHGGVDRAVIGYTQFMADRESSIILVGTADE